MIVVNLVILVNLANLVIQVILVILDTDNSGDTEGLMSPGQISASASALFPPRRTTELLRDGGVHAKWPVRLALEEEIVDHGFV